MKSFRILFPVARPLCHPDPSSVIPTPTLSSRPECRRLLPARSGGTSLPPPSIFIPSPTPSPCARHSKLPPSPNSSTTQCHLFVTPTPTPSSRPECRRLLPARSGGTSLSSHSIFTPSPAPCARHSKLPPSPNSSTTECHLFVTPTPTPSSRPQLCHPDRSAGALCRHGVEGPLFPLPRFSLPRQAALKLLAIAKKTQRSPRRPILPCTGATCGARLSVSFG